jgi:hypothetical protein
MGKRKKGRAKGLTPKSEGSAWRLWFRETCLGAITEVTGDFPWMYGKLIPSAEAAPFQDFFQWMVDEDNASKEPPFEEKFLNEDNWFIEDEGGKRVGISMPAVHEDGLVAWRWR